MIAYHSLETRTELGLCLASLLVGSRGSTFGVPNSPRPAMNPPRVSTIFNSISPAIGSPADVPALVSRASPPSDRHVRRRNSSHASRNSTL
jgi:hypothetical protein